MHWQWPRRQDLSLDWQLSPHQNRLMPCRLMPRKPSWRAVAATSARRGAVRLQRSARPTRLMATRSPRREQNQGRRRRVTRRRCLPKSHLRRRPTKASGYCLRFLYNQSGGLEPLSNVRVLQLRGLCGSLNAQSISAAAGDNVSRWPACPPIPTQVHPRSTLSSCRSQIDQTSTME